MKYKCIGKLHEWGWIDFKEEIKGNLVDFEIEDHICVSRTYEVENTINNSIIEKYKDIIITPLEELD